MAFQPGDVINFARVAWDIYNFGWTAELRSSTQYAEFGNEFRHLAENLKILANVVHKAQESLRSHGVRNTDGIRWDPDTLLEIIGDFQSTLRECRQLLHDNKRYSAANNPLRSIEWNVLVQPTADRLRVRLQLHNARLQNVLKPFEIDLLTRIHHDLAERIGAVHTDVRQVHSELRTLIGVLVPDLRTALEQQDARQIRLLPVPAEVERALEVVFRLHPVWQDGQYPPLRDLSDAFIMALEKSTKSFTPGLTVGDRIPSTMQYLNLLTCLFLLSKMQKSAELLSTPPQSHWPSYIKELEEKLSYECEQFTRVMIAPSLPPGGIDPDALHFWVEETPTELIDTVTTKVMMEELMEVALFSSTRNVSKRLRLMRHTGTHDKRYRLVISASERTTTGRPRQQKEVMDFDVTTASLNPVYALSGVDAAPYEMILQANNKIHRLAFCALEDAFLFQQGVTGFKVVDNYQEARSKVSFVVEGEGGSILEEATVQLWIQRRLGGSLVTDSSDSPAPSEPPPPSPIAIPTGPRPLSPTVTSSDTLFELSGRSTNEGIFELSTPQQFDGRGSIASDFGQMRLSSSPGQLFATRPGDVLSRSPITPPSASASRFPTSPNRNQTQTSFGPFSTSPAEDSIRPSSVFSRFRRRRATGESTAASSSARTFSISSNTTATSVAAQSNSSSASDTTVTVQAGGQAKTAVIHSKPLKPLLILLTQDSKTGHRAVVALSIDEKTIPNPQRCWCQQGLSPDGKPCKITAIEQSEGSKALEARRLHSPSGQWDLLPISVVRRKEVKGFGGAEWRGLNRMSILFGTPEARYAFGGGFCSCSPNTEGQVLECMKKGHVGLLGQVRVLYRNQSKRWYDGRYGASVHISNRSLNDGPSDFYR
ncbi:uncharacterized protein DNG_08152 [Cephalotrichum gorgonifer]|uniref:Uncharacterized protein n=1 Tax=Cephalotrichum gorgonifer TaxID=2041049 RepID=A0AAE8N380_9PEZI|nr:uncharacterized protein DNG_08152 [Cephalotrichum gorgonifer]